MSLNKNLKDLRLSVGMTGKELGKELGLTDVTVFHYEKGEREPNIKTLAKLSNLYRVSIDDLINGENLVPTKKEINNEIVVFSHVNGRTESIMCEEYEITSIGNIAYVKAISYGEVRHIIPFNRVKQINLDI
ncbi:helix-turn-helix transcriptional regulator [Clostridium sp. ZBS17]|uniref:helix-turn-helix domain-containing protein n=1 Tax=Clostridium sp. ZBS17 TaxID=2949968 RepID=UPI002079B5FA|nr:helix-turn-helix transcriptional regulator [Clostridium sp. ZBS17]